MILSDLACISALLALVAVSSTAYRQLTHLKLSSQSITLMTSIFAWTIEMIQLYVVAVGSTKIVTAFGPTVSGCDYSSLACAGQTSYSVASILLLYTFAVLAIDWVDASIASSSLQPVHTAPFMLTRAMLFGPEHIWILEPAPLPPPWPTQQSKRGRRRTRHSRSALQTVSQRIQQSGPRNHGRPISNSSGPHITFADGVPAFSSKSRPAHTSDETREHSVDDRIERGNAVDHRPHYVAPPLTPPNSHEGFVRSRVNALSTGGSPSASPLAEKCQAA